MPEDSSGCPLRLTNRFERALRLAASGHRNQVRKGSGVPYIEHPTAVAWILDHAGFEEDVVIAGLFHDLVEDTDVALATIESGFGARIAEIVVLCSEEKLDAEGRKRPWGDRKRDHLASVADAPDSVRAVLLADKLHNLICIQVDLQDKLSVWNAFHAGRQEVLAYYRAMIDACWSEDLRVAGLAESCVKTLAEVESAAG